MKKNEKNKGITLIALIITIIILLILAGVTINMALGENGLFKKSQEAVQRYKNAEKNESDVISSLVDSMSVSELREKISGNEELPTRLTIEGKDVVIPPKFTIAEDSGARVEDGIVVIDEQGNEWVWIPCYVDEANKHGAEIKFDRYDFAISTYTKAQCVEDVDVGGVLPTSSEEYKSIDKYGGYYIARYEAGDKETTMLGKKRGEDGTNIDTTNGDTNNTVVIKKNQAPYNFVTHAQSKMLCEELTNNYNGKAFTKLCSSYTWDTALKFIEKKYNSYSENSTRRKL